VKQAWTGGCSVAGVLPDAASQIVHPVVAVGSDQSVVAAAAYFDGAGVETLVLTVACAATWIVEKLVHAAAFKTFQTCSNHS
jgi:hypothetical protein